MARTTHDKQLERARAKRQQDALARRQSRSRVLVLALVVLVVLALVGAAVLGGRDGGSPTIEDEPGTDAQTTDEATTDDPAATPDDGAEEPAAADRPEGACPPTPDDVPEVASQQYDAPPEMAIDEDATYTATLATTCGDIVLELDPSAAPVAVNNFAFLAREGYYDGIGFHRVIDGFMIQAGDPEGTGSGGPGYSFEDELGAAEEVVAEEGVYPQGSLAMANAGPDTNGSQFFIVESEEGAPLPPDYTLFGRVVEGMDVVEAIALGPVEGDLAVDPVVITSATVEETS